MIKKFTVGIIGAGSIGALKPDNIDSPATELPLTHAHAVYDHSGFELAWIYDIDPEKMIKAEKKWKCNDKDFNLKKDLKADIIVVSSPTDTHLSVIQRICEKRSAKLIILEKPVTSNIHECTKVDYLTKEVGIQVLVNYPRMYCNSIRTYIEKIIEEKIQSVVFYYTRGFIRDGCHAINMINQLGYFAGGEITGTAIIDFSPDDPTYAAVLQYKNNNRSLFNAFLIPTAGNHFDIFEMHVMTQKARWIFDNHFAGICRWKAEKERVYGNYLSMPGVRRKRGFRKTELNNALWNLYNQAHRLMSNKTDNIYSNSFYQCSISDALEVHNVIEKLMTNKALKEKGINQ